MSLNARVRLSLLIAVLALLATASSASAISFGQHWNGNPEESREEMEAVQRSGATVYHMSIERWRWVKGGPGLYDQVMGEAAEHGITILPVLGNRADGAPGWPVPGEPEYGDWLEWAKEVVRRYGYEGTFWKTGSGAWEGIPKYRPVTAWEVFNEPNLVENSPPVPRPNGEETGELGCIAIGEKYYAKYDNCEQPGGYGQFLVAASAAIRSAQEEIQPGKSTEVLFGGLLYRENNKANQFLERAYAVPGVATAFDGLSIHPYSFGTNHTTTAEFQAEVESARTTLTGLGSSKPLWITEVGWPIATDDKTLFPPVTESEQATLLRDSFNWAVANQNTLNLRSITWYNFRDRSDLPKPSWAYTIGLRTPTGAYRPSWSAYLEVTGQPAWPPATPTFEKVRAGNLGEEAATLSAYVTPNGTATSYKFEYGPTAAYGYSVPIPSASVGSGWNRQAVSNEIKNLEPGSVYHFRLVTTNGAGTVNSPNQTFQTLSTIQSSRSAARDVFNNQWVFYPGANGQICAWTWTNTEGWESGCHTGTAPAAGTVPAFLREVDNHQQVAYVSAAGKICVDEYVNGGSWSSGCPAGEDAAAKTSPTAARDSANNLYVYYTGANQQICSKQYSNAAGWSNGCLGGEKAAAGTSPTLLRDAATNNQWVYYTGANKKVCVQEFTNSTGWSTSCLSGLEVLPGTSPVAARNRSNSQWVYFVGSNHQICGWNYTNVEGWTGGCREGQQVANDTSPTFVRDSANSQWIYYTGSNGHVCGWNFTNAEGWTGGCREGETVAAKTSPTLIRSSNNAQTIFYTGTNQKICTQSFENATGWDWGCPGQTIASGASPVAAREGSSESIFYPGSDGRVCSWDSTASGWGGHCLAKSAVAAGSSIGFARESGSNRWTYYRGSNGQICGHAYAPISGWEGSCREAGQAAAVGTTPVVLRNSSNDQWVYYAGTNGQVCRYAFTNSTGWTPSCIGGQAISSGSSPAAIREGSNHWTYYVGSNGRICGMVYTPTAGWEGGCQAAGQAAATGTIPTIQRNSSNDQWISYAGTNGQVCRYVFTNSTGWTPSCIGPQAVTVPE